MFLNGSRKTCVYKKYFNSIVTFCLGSLWHLHLGKGSGQVEAKEGHPHKHWDPGEVKGVSQAATKPLWNREEEFIGVHCVEGIHL